MDIIEHYRVDLVIYSSNFHAIQCSYGGPYGLKEHRNVFMVIKCFLSTKLLKHPSPIKRVLYINLDTSDVPMQHLCITAPKYGGLYRTFYDIRNTQFLSIFLVIRVQKWKMTDRLCCKLSALSKHAKPCDKLWISLSEAPISIESTARPLYFILIQPKRFYFLW